MFDLKKIRFRTAGALVAIAAVAPIAVAQAALGTPKLTANPTSVMVNTDTTITGGGFPAHTLVTLTECGAKLWLAPKDPCNTENTKTVETNTRGHFTTPFEAQLCPEGKRAKLPTTVICYIGVKFYVEDVGKLDPAARVKVTYP